MTPGSKRPQQAAPSSKGRSLLGQHLGQSRLLEGSTLAPVYSPPNLRWSAPGAAWRAARAAATPRPPAALNASTATAEEVPAPGRIAVFEVALPDRFVNLACGG